MQQSLDGANKNILLTPMERSTVDSILLDIGNEPKQVIKIYAHDNPQTYWTIPVTRSHNADDVCRIISNKLGNDLRYQLLETCSGKEIPLEGAALIVEVLNKRRKNKKYQFVIRPTGNKPKRSSVLPSAGPPANNEESFVRIYYHLNPATDWTIPLSVTLTCADICSHIAGKLQLPDKDSCYIYLVDDSRSGAAPVPVTQDQNIKGLLVQHRNAPVRLVVAFKQLAEGAVIPPLTSTTPEVRKASPITPQQLQPYTPQPTTHHESLPQTIPHTRLYYTRDLLPTNFPIVSLPQSVPTANSPIPNPISALTAPSISFTPPSPTGPRSASPSSGASKREMPRDQLSPANDKSPTTRIYYLDQLRHDLKEEQKAMDRRYRSYDDSWLDIAGYDKKPPPSPPEEEQSPSPTRHSTSPSPNRLSPSPKRKLLFGSSRSAPTSRASTPNRLSRDASPFREEEEELHYSIHPMEHSAATLKESLGGVNELDNLSRGQYREEVIGYEKKLKEALASVHIT